MNGNVFDVLADAQGNVIVAHEKLVWTSESHTATAGDYRIEARTLWASS